MLCDVLLGTVELRMAETVVLCTVVIGVAIWTVELPIVVIWVVVGEVTTWLVL